MKPVPVIWVYLTVAAAGGWLALELLLFGTALGEAVLSPLFIFPVISAINVCGQRRLARS